MNRNTKQQTCTNLPANNTSNNKITHKELQTNINKYDNYSTNKNKSTNKFKVQSNKQNTNKQNKKQTNTRLIYKQMQVQSNRQTKIRVK